MIHRAYKTKLKPTREQVELLTQCAGCARFVYNWAIDKKAEAYASGDVIPNYVALGREITKMRNTSHQWMRSVSSIIPNEALQDADAAWKRTKRPKVPEYKKKHAQVQSFRLRFDIHVRSDSVKLPKIGWVRLWEKGYLPGDTKRVKICYAAVILDHGEWFVSLSVQEPSPAVPEKDRENPVVGIDLGVKSIAVCSSGEVFQYPRSLAKIDETIGEESENLRRKKPGSRGRMKSAERIKSLSKKRRAIRDDFLHKLTTSLTKAKSEIVIEDLDVQGMLDGPVPPASILFSRMAECRRQLEYKGAWYGCAITVADRYFPSSKLCSSCGEKNTSLKLSDREWTCRACGTLHDRDMNAAVNLSHLAERRPESINACA
jgi:putative transposase